MRVKFRKIKYELNYPRSCTQGISYGSLKLHKLVINSCLKFRRILLAIVEPTFKLARFLVPILSPLTVNEL